MDLKILKILFRLIFFISSDMKKGEDEILRDPAKSHPWKKFIIRDFTTNFIIYLILIIPALVFYLV
jgi:hypothetical protein